MYCIIANVIKDKLLRKGAKVRLVDWHVGGRNHWVRGLSKGGRYITKIIPYKKLTDFRVTYIDWMKKTDCLSMWKRQDKAQEFATHLVKTWDKIRAYDHQGNLIKDGVPETSLYKKVPSANVYIPFLKKYNCMWT